MIKTVAALLIASALLTGCGEERGSRVWVDGRWIEVGQPPIDGWTLRSVTHNGKTYHF